jgi:glycosyltransferase involved in cell wall biosynthesis
VRTYDIIRFKLFLEKGPLFYLAFNVRLFLYLLFSKGKIYISNDLDTLSGCWLASVFTGSELYYDSHEYFTGVPELVSRPSKQKIWKKAERFLIPKVKRMWTVNDSIARLYKSEYKREVSVVRNLPFKRSGEQIKLKRTDFKLPENEKIFLYQGAGINVDRGAEEAVDAIVGVENAALLFIGSGDIFDNLKRYVASQNLEKKVFFIGRQPFHLLDSYTRLADFGLTLDKDTNINYRFSLPNKLFDYIQAGLPVIASNLPEVNKIVEGYSIGITIPHVTPHAIADAMRIMMNRDIAGKWKENLNIAANELCWEKEQIKLLEIFNDVD